uniref:M48 family peptidase n=1 Tax=Archaeoglobus fulgidus TaxID=2234 RepID=A0A7C3RN33_ARCFL
MIRHELVHLKVKDLNHGSLFLKEMKKFYSEKEIEEIERSIMEKVILLLEKAEIFSLSFCKI